MRGRATAGWKSEIERRGSPRDSHSTVRTDAHESEAVAVTNRRIAPHGSDQVTDARTTARAGRSDSPTPTSAAGRPPEPASPLRPGDAPRTLTSRTAAPTRPGERASDAQSDILRQLGEQVGKDQFERYFLGQTRLVMHDGSLDVVVSSGFLAQLIERRFGDQLRSITGAKSVSFTVNRDAFTTATPLPMPAPTPSPARVPGGAPANQRAQTQPRPVLRFHLKDYIVGSANRLAYTAATRLADEDAPNSPVFIHGVCGVGKTHLVQGVANLFLDKRPGASVRYVTGETFTNDFLGSLKNNRVDAFRKSYRAADMLVIDDVHFLTNKDHTQQELLHTFDALGLSGARILIASDEHPREIAKLAQKFSDKLVSRFMSGAVVRLEAPDAELRRRLVKHLAGRRKIDLDDAAAELLAQRSERAPGSLGGFGGSVRELEGLLNQVEAVFRLLPGAPSLDKRVTQEVVRRALGLEAQTSSALTSTSQPRRPIPVQTIVDFVCRNLQVDVGEFMGRGRHKRVVFARSLASHLSRLLTTQSFPEIARAMGRTNHSTVITAQRRLQRSLETRPDEVLPIDLAPLHPGTTAAELLRNFTNQIRQAAR